MRPSLKSILLSIGLVLTLIRCSPAEPDSTPALVENSPTPAETATHVPPTATAEPSPTSESTATLIVPTQTLAPTATAIPATPDTDSVLSNLVGNGSNTAPQLDVEGAPTRRPTATPQPATDVDPFSDGLTVERQGSGFGPTVASNPGLDYFKIGFHIGPSGDFDGLSDWMQQLDAAGIPFTLKSVGNAGPLVEAQELMRASGVEHVLVYRRSNDEFELPDYDLNPVQAAREHWERHKAIFPPELDPALVWFETINEPDKGRSAWLGAFALETGRLAIQDGYKWAAFGWSSGEPELEHWAHPDMVPFLIFASENPDRIAISLHEYSFKTSTILRQYPFLVGRFQQLYWVCDQLEIDRPTVIITEFGWEYAAVPDPEKAKPQLLQAASIYAGYPEVKGAAIWYLGPEFGGIGQQTTRLIPSVTELALSTYYERPVNKRIKPEIFK